MRILLVEDESKVAGFVERGLVAERYAVDVSGNGMEAWELTDTYPYDLIILDLMLPGLDGADLLRRIRKKNTCVPVLVLTARDAVDEKVRIFELGADDYLTKPFALAELQARLRALMRRGFASGAATLRYADLELDRRRRRVNRGQKAIPLTSKEFALLEFLLLRAPESVTRSEIIEHVWDMQFDNESNLLEVYVNRLRQKIDQGRAVKLIHTLRGVGYRLGVSE